MSKKKISPRARPKGPSPEQNRNKNLVIAMLIAVAVVVAASIAVIVNIEGKGTTPGQQTIPSNTAGIQSAASTQQLNLVQADKSAHRVTIDTARGQIVMEVCPDLMPVTVANFDKLVKDGFYNGLTFHRVEDWVIQGGDPKGDGTGGSGQTIRLETNPQLKNVRGAVAMARSSDPNSASSQFYVLKKDMPSLDGQYAVFGMVVQGMDIVDQIQIGDKMTTVQE
jgi:peptidyl-prolyl cis-trans isomerase B (cyclophilin B)